MLLCIFGNPPTFKSVREDGRDEDHPAQPDLWPHRSHLVRYVRAGTDLSPRAAHYHR